MTTFSRSVVNGMFNVADGIVTAEGKLIEFGEKAEDVLGKIAKLVDGVAYPFEKLAEVIGGAKTQISSMVSTGSFDYGAAGSQGFDNSPTSDDASKNIPGSARNPRGFTTANARQCEQRGGAAHGDIAGRRDR